MSTDTTLEKVILKIQKLMSLTESPNENEAKAALAMAQRLMTEYQLSEIDILSEELNNELVVSTVEAQNKNFVAWERNLLWTLCKHNLCKMNYYPKSNKVKMFGSKGNISLVLEMYRYIRAQVNVLCEIAWDNNTQKFGVAARTWKNSYKLGLVWELDEIMEKSKEEVIVESGSTAIVLVKQEEVDKFYEENSNAKKVSHKYNIDSNGYYAGVRDANKVSMRGLTD